MSLHKVICPKCDNFQFQRQGMRIQMQCVHSLHNLYISGTRIWVKMHDNHAENASSNMKCSRTLHTQLQHVISEHPFHHGLVWLGRAFAKFLVDMQCLLTKNCVSYAYQTQIFSYARSVAPCSSNRGSAPRPCEHLVQA